MSIASAKLYAHSTDFYTLHLWLATSDECIHAQCGVTQQRLPLLPHAASCAARLRRLSEAAEITIFEKGPYVSFANCGLPYHVGGVIPVRKQRGLCKGGQGCWGLS